MRRIRNMARKIPFLKKGDEEKRKDYARDYAKKAKTAFDSGVKKMGTEAQETKEMAHSFFHLLEHKLKINDRSDPPTEQEIREAIEQLKDVGRVSFFATISIIPGGAVSLIGLEMLAAKFGMKNFTLIPSSFRKNADWHYPKDKKDESSGI